MLDDGVANGAALRGREPKLSLSAALASDHALIARLLCNRSLRWEAFRGGDGSRGELCYNGLRYSTELDDFGVPLMPAHLRSAIVVAWPISRQAAE